MPERGTPILHGYFRSTASWRVRLVLGLKGIGYANRFHHLRRGEQNALDYRALNPQGLLPAFETGQGDVLTQSLAICEYLDELYPAPPLLPGTAIERARVRGFAQIIACDVHPVQNLKILARLRALDHDEETVNDWARTVIADGLDACEALVGGNGGPFCFGRAVTLADICLVPQLGNARRFGVDLRWPRLLKAETACNAIDAFRAATPAAQPDAEA